MLSLETLEERTLLSILFNPGAAVTTSEGNGPVLDHVHVELVFWGTGWSSNDTLRSNLINATDSLVGGPYLTGLSQYRSTIGTGQRVAALTITSTSPASTFSDTDVANILRTNINNGVLLNPARDSQLLYMVIPQPGSSANGLQGEHSLKYSTMGPFHYGWTTNNGSLDFITTVYSHELAESVTDPSGTAIQVNPRDSNNWNEIGDGDARLYTYRLNNVLVQSYWSQRDRAYIVPTGQSQNFVVSPSRVLTVNGDQLPNRNDTITIDRTSSNGISVTENGETAQFDPNAISSVTVTPGTGTDTINIEKTVAGHPVAVNLGSDTDTVNISPSARNLAHIQGNVTLNGGRGTGTMVVNDQAASANLGYTLTGSTVTRDSSATISFSSIQHVSINGGTGTDSYNIINTQATNPTTLNTDTGVAAVTVRGTTGPLTVLGSGGGAGDVVTVGSGGTLQNILGSVTIENPPSLTTVLVDDSADNSARTFQHDSFTPTGDSEFGRIAGLAAAPINYEYNDTRSLTINTGPGGVTANILGTGVNLTLAGNRNANNTLVGPNAPSTWTLTDRNSGTVSSPSLRGRITFYSMPNLAGGSSDDTFVLQNGGSVAGNIDGGSGTNTLDYSPCYGNVYVNLRTRSGINVGGRVANIQNVKASAGADANILVGNGGNVLTGGSHGRNLLIAGGAAGSLHGGNNQDLLIGGTTAYDTDVDSLIAIMAEWSRTDEDYHTRIDNLMAGTVALRLNPTTVTSNGGRNTLLAGPGLSWFFGNPDRDNTNWNPASEVFTHI
jgi:hypothetical protein